MSTRVSTQIADIPSIGIQRLVASVVPILLGVFIIYGVAFAPIEAIHSAAHDTRHSIVSPCH
jgi:cobalt transporter subunit CbtB